MNILWPSRHTATAICASNVLAASKCVDCATTARFSRSNASGVLLVSDSKHGAAAQRIEKRRSQVTDTPTMKKISVSIAALALAISAGSAFAADLPSRKAAVVPPPPPPTIEEQCKIELSAEEGWATKLKSRQDRAITTCVEKKTKEAEKSKGKDKDKEAAQPEAPSEDK